MGIFTQEQILTAAYKLISGLKFSGLDAFQKGSVGEGKKSQKQDKRLDGRLAKLHSTMRAYYSTAEGRL